MTDSVQKRAEPNLSETARSRSSAEVQVATRNGAKLFASLLGTLSVAFAVRFWLPHYLGPQVFGQLHFAQEFSAAAMVFLTLGAETYIAKEVSTRREHASDIWGGLVALRFALLCLASLVVYFSLGVMGKNSEVVALTLTFLLAHFVFVNNQTFSAMLNARMAVNELAVINVVLKIVWGAGAVLGVLLGFGLMAVAVSFVVSELLRALALYFVCRRHLDLRFLIDMRAVNVALLLALPFFANYVSHRLAANVDVTMISAMVNDAEVGWYGGAQNVNFVIFLVLPILNAMLLPMTSRIAKESLEELKRVIKGAIRMILMVTAPMALLLMLNAQEVVSLLFGESFMPTTPSLQAISLLVPVTYINVLFSTHLIQIERGWDVALVSALALGLNPSINLFLIPYGLEQMGPGGAGFGASVATISTEIVTMAFLASLLWRQKHLSVSMKEFGLLLRILIACALTWGAHRGLQGLTLDSGDPWWTSSTPVMAGRVVVQGLVGLSIYVVVASGLGALPLRDIVNGVIQKLKRR